MELRVSAQERGLSPSVCESDPDEKEISEDDDDDRNHKHRRREDARSQSLERDTAGHIFTKSHRRGNKNGNLYSEAGSQSRETWKNYNLNPTEKDISARFDKKRPGFTQFSRGSSDLNQRTRVNQAFSGDTGLFRGRGRAPGPWGQLDPRFNSVDIASQIVQQGSIHPSLFAGRGLPNVSSAHGASWNAFGFVPGISNGGLDTLHPLGLQGSYRSAINPSLNVGLPRQRCRDFEEQGFCLRGDMCPMEHGVNRIVVEDVQSLSQFNLPGSLPSANIPVAPTGPGSLPSNNAPTSSLSNKKCSQSKTSKHGVDLDGTFIDSAAAAGTDFYDPDQPLWANDSQTSTALLSINQSNIKDNKSLMDPAPSGGQCAGQSNVSDNEQVVRNDGTPVGSDNTGSFVWGRISRTKAKTEMRENTVSKASPSDVVHNMVVENQEPLNGAQGALHHGKWNNFDSSLKIQSGNGQGVRKPYQKAQRTLFVNGIPQQNNRRESLLSHFKKFGEIIDIYIPSNSERAFVQFSKREEAEAALMAPDAVMANRFIKLLWANRDNIPDSGTMTGHNMPIPPHVVPVSSLSPYISVANKGKPNPQSSLQNGIIAPASVPNVLASTPPKPVVANNPKAPPRLQKKLDSLEVLKEELRKKQEMLEQKRNDFRRKLDKFEKQATGVKGEVEPEQVAKKQKSGVAFDLTKPTNSSSSDPDTILRSPQGEVTAHSSKSVECARPQSSRTTLAAQEPASVKPSVCPLAPVGPSVTNRFKLDNRPTAFKIVPPLPNDLAEVAVLKEHFSSYGDLSKVELEDTEPIDVNNPESSKPSARIYFATRHSAEKAFTSGKCLKGHNLQFTWLKPSKSESPSSKGNSAASIQPILETSKTAVSGNEESEKLEKSDVDEHHTEPDESNS